MSTKIITGLFSVNGSIEGRQHILFRYHVPASGIPMRLHHACVHQCFRYASSITRFSRLEGKICICLHFLPQFPLRMSSSDRESKALKAIQDYREKLASELWREYCKASSKAQTAAFQYIQEDILLQDVNNNDDKDDMAKRTVNSTCTVSTLGDSSEGTVNQPGSWFTTLWHGATI